MSRQKTFLVADTETTGLASRSFVFDFGYVIATRTRVLLERQFLIRETLTDARIMLGALFNPDWRAMMGGKIFEVYIPALASGNMHLYSWRDVCEQLRDDMRTHNVEVFCAYNLGFDMRALAVTQKRICDGGKVLEYKTDLLDLWKFACVTVLNTQLYHDVARARGGEWITPANNVRTTAEKTYAFLTGDLDFIESHTALHDAQIETEILQRLLAKKKIIPYNEIDHMPWKYAQNIIGKLV